jgi:hypothetical protein
MNLYRTWFAARCVNNGKAIEYDLQIESENFIMAEKIEDAVHQCAAVGMYHEEIADFLHVELGGVQTLHAWHGRVELTTVRG